MAAFHCNRLNGPVLARPFSRVENGEIDTPPLDTIAEIANLLYVSSLDLFCFERRGYSAEELR
jgi:hypothetical protein